MAQFPSRPRHIARPAALLLAALLPLCACAGGPGAGGPAAGKPEAAQSANAADPRQGRSAHAASLVADSARCLSEMRAADPKRRLEAALREAQGVVVLPGVYQAGFLYSLKAGDGVLVARRPDGGFGAPVFVRLAGAGYGLQAGLERSRLVLVLNDEGMLDRVLAGSLDLDATVLYDVLGVREESGPSTFSTRRPVEAYADGVGLMAGIALKGGVLGINEDLTMLYHGRDDGDVEAVLRGASAPGLESFALWNALYTEPAAPHITRTAMGQAPR